MRLPVTILDRYIIRRFIATFMFIMGLFLAISIVIDLTERLEVFLRFRISFATVVTDYYAGFVPWIISLLGPFFVFLAVIWVASRMTYNSEMVSVIGSGITFNRVLVPFLVAAGMLFVMFWFGNNYLVPRANAKRIEFDSRYVTSWNTKFDVVDLTTIKRGNLEIVASMQSYNTHHQRCTNLSLKTVVDHHLTEFLQATTANWMPEKQMWQLSNYEIWSVAGSKESLRKGRLLDTMLSFTPDDLVFKVEIKETMPTPRLNEFIQLERDRGSERIPFYQVEKHQRTSNAFSVFILTLMGVAVSMRRVRGGRYWPLAFGMATSAIFFLFMRFSTTFATNAGLHPVLACWLPNAVFSIAAVIMLRVAPK